MTDTSEAIVASLTTAEKASLTSGADFWTTKSVERAEIPSVMLTDGPHGLRKQAGASDHLGLNNSVPATCFPPAAALGSTFDPELAERVGEALGVESAIEDVAVILGPGINIKRSPLCGRNFEYVSEDPILSGDIATGLVKGIQSKGVGASLKHFAANSQEYDRMRASSDVDPRPLREIYLRGFERVVKGAQPWTVMCSYNRINGVYASEDPWLLTDVLRKNWGFAGLVVSDWGAVNNRVLALSAGLDLEMPSSGGVTDAQIVAAVESGVLPESVLDTAAARIVDMVRKASARPAVEGPLDIEAHHALAREVAGRSIVLLKNDDVDGVPLLPLAPGQSIAVIGEFARTPRFQGGGSSHINPTRLDSALGAFGESAAADRVSFAPGFSFDPTTAEEDLAAQRAEAVQLAAARDVAVLFLGLTDAEESEGADRSHIDLAASQLALLDAVVEANPRTVVVLSNGSAVALPFADRVPAVVEAWLLGQAGGSAIVDVLVGAVNPSARLAETIPVRLEDTPAFGNFPGSFGHVRYGEGVFVGYRWYDQRRMAVTYPFGHGLSYTAFEYGEAHLASVNGDLVVSVPVTNTGGRDGREVVQVYVAPLTSIVERAPRELKAFASVEIPVGETREVTLTVRREDLAYWDTRVDRFVVEGGGYRVEVGASSRDIRAEGVVDIEGDAVLVPLTLESSVAELLSHPVAGPIIAQQLSDVMDGMGGAEDGGALTRDTLITFMSSLPIGRLAMFPGVGVEKEQLRQLIAMANAPRA